jgi:hypothetical protein
VIESSEYLHNTLGFDSLLDYVSVNGIAMPKKIPWDGLEWEGFQNLLCCPGSRGMSRDVEGEDTTTVMCQNDKYE